ncbi:serine hydrolase domain-containing protein [Pseudonocardia parietis]|uniref:CubicO group peptidase (Beta-lactamase class C family) n=1 Tax=Pseudonocardia parietis TaxID=570936 RepID=A0ABS4VT66_9PSEU|nr:serine hydrolase domain-containing protein [Pseudonocardia parietis]MBP2367105.1 CubicO group peptidase (beta-lactamase class C family) [Pseudonocardia parietis]
MPELLPSTQRTLLARVARAQRDGRVPSLVAGVVRDGGLAWHTGRGALPGDAAPDDVQYRIGSITKTVCAITVLRLRDEGRLDLDDRLDEHLPGTPLGDRTLGQLLAHLAGAGAESPGLWWERTPGGSLEQLKLSDDDRVLPAGRRFHYSNLGFGLLGELVARARGRDWTEVARREVLLPLGMTRTSPRPQAPAAEGHAVHPWAELTLPEPEHDAGVMAPAGQLWCTARDLARLGAFLLGDTGGVLSPATVEEMTLPAGIDSTSPIWAGYGLGVQVHRVDGATLVGHGGSMPGFLAGLWVDREEGTGALAMGNTTAGMDSGLGAGLLADLRAAEPRIVDAWAPEPSPVDPSLLGPWFWGPSPYVLRAVAGGMLHLGGLGRPGRSSRFRPGPDGAWIGLDGYFAGETLRIGDDHLWLATFVLTRTPYDPAAPVPGGVDGAGWRPELRPSGAPESDTESRQSRTTH